MEEISITDHQDSPGDFDEATRRAGDGLGQLHSGEIFWKEHYDWLLSSGYQLRARYKPDWIPSWTVPGNTKHLIYCEDSETLPFPVLNDAIRVADGVQVVLKRIEKTASQQEVAISMFFSKEPLASDPRNHCIPILDVLQSTIGDGGTILVMPLARHYSEPEFDTFGEAIDFFRQVFEGVQFMHEHHVAHRDIKTNNIMMEAGTLFPNGFHFSRPSQDRDYSGPVKIRHTRTQRPSKYFLIDFGISRQCDPENGPPLEVPILGGDRSVPEFQADPSKPQNPFPTDIYYLGNFIRMDFLDGDPLLPSHNGRQGFEFMRPLINDMIQDDPLKRPTIHEVVTRFEEILTQISSWKLRSRVVPQDDELMDRFTEAIPHWIRRCRFIVARVPAIPSQHRADP